MAAAYFGSSRFTVSRAWMPRPYFSLIVFSKPRSRAIKVTLIVLSESGLEEVKDTAGMEGCRQCAKMAQGACQEAIDATLNARPDPQEGF